MTYIQLSLYPFTPLICLAKFVINQFRGVRYVSTKTKFAGTKVNVFNNCNARLLSDVLYFYPYFELLLFLIERHDYDLRLLHGWVDSPNHIV